MDFRQTTIALNERLVREVARHLGLQLPRNGSATCPFLDHDDTHPSFSISADGRYWKCFGCNRSGGAIDLVKNYQQTSFIEAKRWLAQKIGLDPPIKELAARVSNPTSKSKANKHPTPREPDSLVLTFLYSSMALTQAATHYLETRGISLRTIRRSGVVEFNPPANALGDMLTTFGYARVNASGLLNKHSTPEDVRFIFLRGCLLFPFFSENQVINMQARNIGTNERHGKWRNLAAVNKVIYNRDALYSRSNRPLCICEGIMDVLSAIEFGYEAIGLLGVTTEIQEKEYDYLRGRTVYLLLDWDGPGERKAKLLQTELRKRGIMSMRIAQPSPDIKDLNDLLVKKSIPNGTL